MDARGRVEPTRQTEAGPCGLVIHKLGGPEERAAARVRLGLRRWGAFLRRRTSRWLAVALADSGSMTRRNDLFWMPPASWGRLGVPRPELRAITRRQRVVAAANEGT